MKIYTVIVVDERDAHSSEPESSLGTFDSFELAQDELNEYLQGEHGKYIKSARIEVDTNRMYSKEESVTVRFHDDLMEDE